jgi:hypothetical protein
VKTLTLFLALLPAMSCGADIEGAYFRLAVESLVIERVAARGGESLYPGVGQLHTSYIDYWLRLGRARALIREGDVNLIDPETMDASIEFSHEEEKSGFRILTMVCRYKEELAAAVMISLVPKGEPQTVNPGIYYSVRGPDFAAVLDGLEQVVLKSELRTNKLTEYRRLDDSEAAMALKPLREFLKEKANQPPQTTRGKAPRV